MLKYNFKDLTLSNEEFLQNLTKPVQKYEDLSQPCHPDPHTLSILAKATYKDEPKELPKGWVLLTTAHYKERDGYFGALYHNATHNQWVIAHRGSKNLGSFEADIQGVIRNRCTNQISSAVSFSAFVTFKLEEWNVHLSFTGHSLGGWLAQITTFTTKYLKVEGTGFQKAEEKYHPHAVVFDSPGCKEILTLISEDHKYCRYASETEKLISSLDVTVYLSSPNLVNTCNRHIGTLYRIYPKFENRSFADLLRQDATKAIAHAFGLGYTLDSHTIDQFVTFLKEENFYLKEIEEWPLVTWHDNPKKTCNDSSLLVKIVKMLKDGAKLVIDKIFGNLNQMEYHRFFEFAEKTNNYEPSEAHANVSGIPLHYKTKLIKRTTRKATVFTKKERIFLKNWKAFRNTKMHFTELNAILILENYDELLPDFNFERGFIECISEKLLHDLINRTKRLFFLCPEIHEVMKIEIAKCPTIFESKYQSKTEEYENNLRDKFGTEINFKDRIELDSLEGFLKSRKRILILEVSEDTKLEAWRIHKILKKFKELNVTKEYSNENHHTFLKLEQLVSLENQINIVEIFKSKSKIDNLLAIDYDQNSLYGLQFIEKFMKALPQPQGDFLKKMIIIINKDNDLLKSLSIKSEEITRKESKLTFRDLHDDSTKLILQKKFIQLREENYNLQELVKIKRLEDLSDKMEILEYLIDSRMMINLAKEDDYSINLTQENEFFNCHNLIKIARDIKPETLLNFLKKHKDSHMDRKKRKIETIETLIDHREFIFVITGFKADDDDLQNELLEYLNDECKELIEDLIENEVIILLQGNDDDVLNHEGLSSKHKNKIIYWLRLNYDEEKTIQILQVFNYDLYIHREFYYKRVIDESFIKILQEFTLIFYNVKNVNNFKNNLETLIKSGVNNDNIKIVQSKQEANSLFKENVNADIFTHLIKVTGDEDQYEYIWKESYGNLDKIYHQAMLDEQILLNEERFIRRKRRLNIIAGVPGMGKSTTLDKFTEKMKASLVIRINISHVKYSEIPDEIKALDQIIKFLVKYVTNDSSNEFYEKLLKISLRSNDLLPVVILLDGFDEIKEDNALSHIIRKKIINLVKYLKKDTTAKVTITTRIYVSKFLEEELSMLAIQFRQISDCDQQTYLMKFWLSHMCLQLERYSLEDQSKLETYTKEILHECNNTLGNKMSEFMGIPLQLMMLGEVFIPTANIFGDATENVDTSIENVCILYERFINRKYEVYFKQKVGCYLDPGIKKSTIQVFHNYHMDLGMKVIFPDEAIESGDCSFLNIDIKASLNRIGIMQIREDAPEHEIQSWENLHIEFNHRTFAEYFSAFKLAQWISDPLKMNSPFRCEEFFTKNILLGQEYKVIRRFLNDFLLKGITDKAQEYFCDYFSRLWSNFGENAFRDSEKKTALHLSATEKNDALFNFALRSMESVKEMIHLKDNHLRTALHEASKSGKLELVQGLINSGANVNDVDKDGETPLFDAVCTGRNDVVAALIQTGANVNHKNKNRKTSLFHAAGLGHKEENSLYQARVNADKKGIPFPDRAISSCYKDVMLSLIKAGANVNDKDNDNVAPLFYAIFSRDIDIVEGLIQNGAKVNDRYKTSFTPLIFAAINGDNNVVLSLIRAGANINEKIAGSFPPIHYAAKSGHKDVVSSLINAGAQVNFEGSTTPLHLASLEGRADAIQILADNGANVHSKDTRGETPLFNAAMHGCEITLSRLIELGANVNEENNSEETPLFLAASMGLKTVVQYLIDNGANVDHKDQSGETPLFKAVASGLQPTIGYLIEHGANINHKSESGETPLICAASIGLDDIVQLLIQLGANINDKDETGETALFKAVNEATVRCLLENGAKVDDKNNLGETPLMCAASNDNNDMVRCLIQFGANVNVKDETGETALFKAASNDNKDVVKKLIEAGANVNDLPKDYKLPDR